MRRWQNAVDAVVMEASVNGAQYTCRLQAFGGGLQFRVSVHLWRIGDPLGLEVLRDAIRLDPILRRQVERMLIKGYSEGR